MFEYLFVQINFATGEVWQDTLAQKLNIYGREGWELVNFQLHGVLSCIFKRKK